MIFNNLRHDNWWSRDNFSNQITDADKACRSSEISVDVIISLFHLSAFYLHWRCIVCKRVVVMSIVDILLCVTLNNKLPINLVTTAHNYVHDDHNRSFLEWQPCKTSTNQITDADKACRSSEISVDVIISIVFL
jgi:hypothetical protein